MMNYLSYNSRLMIGWFIMLTIDRLLGHLHSGAINNPKQQLTFLTSLYLWEVSNHVFDVFIGSIPSCSRFLYQHEQ